MSIKITITCGKKSYSETLSEEDIAEEKEHFEECQNSGANPHLEKITWEHYSRPIDIDMDKIDDYNGNHFIFGWMECFGQSDFMPDLWTNNEGKRTTLRVELCQ